MYIYPAICHSKYLFMKKLLMIPLLFVIISAKTQINDMSKWKTQVDPQFFSSIKYPPDWKVMDVNRDGYMIISPKEGSNDKYQENVSIAIIPAPPGAKNLKVRDFAETNYIEFKKYLKDCRLMADKPMQLFGTDVYFIMYNGINEQGQYLYFKQNFIIYKGNYYILTYTGDAGKRMHLQRLAAI